MKKIQALFSLRQPANRLALVAAVAVAPMAARADAIDVSTLTTALTAAGVACAAIGTAYLVVVVGVKSYKLIRSAM